jgi:hypothetical protein
MFSNHLRNVQWQGIGEMKFGRTISINWSSVASLAVECEFLAFIFPKLVLFEKMSKER